MFPWVCCGMGILDELKNNKFGPKLLELGKKEYPKAWYEAEAALKKENQQNPGADEDKRGGCSVYLENNASSRAQRGIF